MAYTYSYINKLKQFNSTSYTLILEDSDAIMPLIRNDKYFSDDDYPNLCQKDLEDEAARDINLYTQDYLDQQYDISDQSDEQDE